ncbi:MAG: nucleotide exchange factor GrpE [Armatimonadetes bacterium]|nr:nucleotide exchange factor GrpE [Armatimonadota bacterium]
MDNPHDRPAAGTALPLEELEEETAAESAAPATSEEHPGVSELSELLRQRDAQIHELEEQVKRVSADFENFRRRQTEEQKRVLARLREGLFRSLLPIMDHMERALQASRGEGSPEGLVKGLELVKRDVLKIFEENGVLPIQAEGQQFDPALHEAVLAEDREDLPDQTIVQELQRGYVLGDRVLRPSMVKVAKNS